MTATRNSVRQDWLSVPRRREEERLDPHVYERGINGLTVEEATQRAYPRVMGILKRSGEEYSAFEGQLVREAVLEGRSVGERVASPVGPGEGRYLSDDGNPAAVKLDGGSGSEVWLPIVKLFRIDPEYDAPE